MKKYLLSETGNFYKANMHCHTTISDGKMTPEQIKDLYLAKGYSIVAFTDHDVLIDHSDLCDDVFLALNGYEMEFTETGDKPTIMKKTAHFCFVAKEPDNLKQVCFHRSKYLIGNAVNYRDEVIFDETEPDFERDHDPVIINKAIEKAKENGFFVTYNHPAWSLENYSHYSRYEGFDAMEMYNYSCLVSGFIDFNEKEYDDLLRLGKRVYCVGGDDNHNSRKIDSRRFDSCGAYTVIKAEKLEYRAIAKALENGNFYSSLGPMIKVLWYEDGYIYIETSEVDRIVMHTSIRPTFIEYAEKDSTLTGARFEIKPEYGYVRFTVFDKNNLPATTNAYFLEDFYM